ncbi:MAG: TrkA C-terminal domain-containing protein, partial [Rhodoferax sp.]|nr:TrkA C-terminal domain-containing protein [Rhodoferax sp.]
RDDDTVDELQQVRLSSVTLPPAAVSVGQPLGDLLLTPMGVQVAKLRRASGEVLAPDDSHVLTAGDTLVLSGLPEPLALAEAKLLKG